MSVKDQIYIHSISKNNKRKKNIVHMDILQTPYVRFSLFRQ